MIAIYFHFIPAQCAYGLLPFCESCGRESMTKPLEQSSWQPPEGWDDEDATAAALNKAKSTLARWRRETRKQGRQVGPPFSYMGLNRQPIYNIAERLEWLRSNRPTLPRAPRARSRQRQHEASA
jgi:hypothetical protein